MNLPPLTAALHAHLAGYPGATAEPMTASRGKEPLVVLFKVFGKMFAILSVRGQEFVILKSDFAEVLREQYAGVGHRSHLDRRFWISVDLDSDVPRQEVESLAAASYALVAAGLTKKQQAALRPPGLTMGDSPK